MTMPLRPVRVAGGSRLWLATFFTDWVREVSGRCRRGLLVPGGSRLADALMASVIDSAECSTSLSRGFFAVARPERFVERCDFLRRRAIFLGLRDAATGLQTQTERAQFAQPLRRDLELEAARSARAFPDGDIPALARGHGVQDDERLVARLCESDEVGRVLQRLQIENGALQRDEHHRGFLEGWADRLVELWRRGD